jgi:hypothetical protein
VSQSKDWSNQEIEREEDLARTSASEHPSGNISSLLGLPRWKTGSIPTHIPFPGSYTDAFRVAILNSQIAGVFAGRVVDFCRQYCIILPPPHLTSPLLASPHLTTLLPSSPCPAVQVNGRQLLAWPRSDQYCLRAEFL